MSVAQLAIICAARIHCPACRNSERQRAMLGMAEVCPEGFTAERLPYVPGEPEWLTLRHRICTPSCPDECAMHHQSDCKRRGLLARRQFVCPTGRF